ncbi:MAG: SDR family oxidoreductase [Cyclobacteriaceae bacterium]|nr:SDR family oxidoreductase [Cyclobacteriaceae bacterium]
MKLKGKVIVVTGGSGLIGKAIVEFLTNEGAVCINADISLKGKESPTAMYVDINDAASIQGVIDRVTGTYGRLDGLVNNAYPKPAGYGSKSFQQTPHALWMDFVNTNLNGYYLCAYYALEKMRSLGIPGSLVNVASIYGMIAPDFSLYEGTEMNFPGEYTVVKGGIINFTKYLAAVYGPSGIRVNSVSPGGIANNQHPEFVKRYSKKVMMGRMGEANEVASCISFLLSDDASYISAHNLVIDGGLSAA